MTTHRFVSCLAFLLTSVAAHGERRRAVAPEVPLDRVLVAFMAEFLPDPPNAWTTQFIVNNDGADFEVIPASTVVDLTGWIESHLPDIPQARVTIEIKSTHKLWAFMTVINDQSHPWTNITADR